MLRPSRLAARSDALHSRCPTFACLAALALLATLGACTHLTGEREAYLHSRQIMVEMDVVPIDEPVRRIAAWPGPEFNLTLVRGDSLWPTELAKATPIATLP